MRRAARVFRTRSTVAWSLGLFTLVVCRSEIARGADESRLERIDLVQLATQYVDAVGTWRIVSLEYQRLEQLGKTRSVPTEKIEIARIQLESARNKVDVLSGIVEIELSSATRQVELLRAAEDETLSARIELANAEKMVQVIQLIKASRPAGIADSRN